MKYSQDEVLQYIREENVKFIRLVFCDVFGKQKNIAIMPDELEHAFAYGISFDASAIAGFGDVAHSDLLLRPDPATLALLPWRPEHGKVVRMFSDILYPDGRPFEGDTRRLLKNAVADAQAAGCSFAFGPEQEFYLFVPDANGKKTTTPYDDASYMDLAPDDRGENIRREICLTLEQMGIRPEGSHHEEGPGQNEIDFHFTDALSAAENTMTFQTVVKTVANRNGLVADFSAKPLENQPGNGFHINISVNSNEDVDYMHFMIAGILDKIEELTAFLNPTKGSYQRLSADKAPGHISWSNENRSQLIRIPAAVGEYRRAELRSPDPMANPYLAFSLLIYAGLYGIEHRLPLPQPANLNLYEADENTLRQYRRLPATLNEACRAAKKSEFVKTHVPQEIIEIYCGA